MQLLTSADHDKPFALTPLDRYEAAGAQRENSGRGPVTVAQVITRAVDVERTIDEDFQSEKHRRNT